MEKNHDSAQEQPAQRTAPETPRPERQPAAERQPQAPAPTALRTQAEEPASGRYNPDELAQIVRCLTDAYFDPEYILLFGSLAGGTPHSDVAAYDLLMVVRNTPEYDWMQAKRILRYKVPVKRREITYINLYVMTLRAVESRKTPFLYFAHAEGELLYCSDRYRFRRPKHPIDFAAAYADAKLHFDTFRILGGELIEQAQDACSESRNRRLAALCMAQAAVCFYHTLYYVYHGEEFGSHDPVVMHDRMRTLSTQLMLVFDDHRIENIFTLPRLGSFLTKARYEVNFDMAPEELEMHLRRVEKMEHIVENYCGLRLELYKEWSDRQ